MPVTYAPMPADRATIDLDNPRELTWWRKRFECSEDQLRRAVARAGASAARVERLLDSRFELSREHRPLAVLGEMPLCVHIPPRGGFRHEGGDVAVSFQNCPQRRSRRGLRVGGGRVIVARAVQRGGPDAPPQRGLTVFQP